MRRSDDLPVYHAAITPPDRAVFVTGSRETGGIALSPDRTTIVYAARADGVIRLWTTRLSSGDQHSLAGTEGAYQPFWSPDNRFVGFFSGGKLKKVDLAGNSIHVICDASGGRGATWNADDQILFSAVSTGRSIWGVSAHGGAPEPVTRHSESDNAHYWPHFLPSGRDFLYLVRSGQDSSNGIFMSSLSSPDKRKLLLSAASSAQYTTTAGESYVFFFRRPYLMAQKFDPDRLELTGQPVPLTENVRFSPAFAWADFSVSNEVLTTGPGGGSPDKLAWRNREGKLLPIGLTATATASPSLSPEGQTVVAGDVDLSGNIDLWLIDTARSLRSRLTFHAGIDSFPAWSADGREIVFTSQSGGPSGVHRMHIGSRRLERLTTAGPRGHYVSDWSGDGRYVVFTDMTLAGGSDIAVVDVTAGSKIVPFLQTPYAEARGRLSPDMRWMAYDSDESGTMQVYIRPFTPGRPASGARVQVSSAGGVEARWRGDGAVLFFLSLEGKMMSATVQARGAEVIVGAPVGLFDTTAFYGSPYTWTYDVSKDGHTFVLLEPDEAASLRPIKLMTDWRTAITRKPR
jgi:Tol biopolymer transport system component